MCQLVDFYSTLKLYYMLMEFVIYLNILIVNTEMMPDIFLDVYMLPVSL